MPVIDPCNGIRKRIYTAFADAVIFEGSFIYTETAFEVYIRLESDISGIIRTFIGIRNGYGFLPRMWLSAWDSQP